MGQTHNQKEGEHYRHEPFQILTPILHDLECARLARILIDFKVGAVRLSRHEIEDGLEVGLKLFRFLRRDCNSEVETDASLLAHILIVFHR